MKAERTL